MASRRPDSAGLHGIGRRVEPDPEVELAHRSGDRVELRLLVVDVDGRSVRKVRDSRRVDVGHALNELSDVSNATVAGELFDSLHLSRV
jgi:hypothetical protein